MRRRLTRAESAARTRERLINAADRVFVKHGFHGASLEEVAERAGYTKSAIFAGFDSKAGLFFAVLDRRLDVRLAEIDELARRAAPHPIRDAAAQWFDRLERDADWQLVVLEFRLHAARDKRLNAALLLRHRRFVERSAEGFRARASSEEAAQEQNAVAAARALIALGNGYALERLTDPEGVGEAEFADVASSLMRSVLGRQARPTRPAFPVAP